ncbi:hypothetical protein CAPTEDRAFT_195748 [Capitella teleta]|uniref:Peptidase M60 domain-containing protein n=1 Tax=Capitella teleta TaxID=283909 RepID=R7UHN9_CAPTE|nr:hypothetical protein CAPTEDRAFT_195748 [Capitella teleta]|eukprot:ELU05583.1 hypothetical protein CAPTEDRAFT_195748 [Capitella teleta]
MELWSEDILEDLTVIPKIGTPGTLVTYGDQASPVLWGEDPSDVVIGAAELGAGRVIALTHESYLKSFGSHENDDIRKLQANLKKWVSFGREKDVVHLKNNASIHEILAKETESVAIVRIIGQKFDEIEVLMLLDFIEHGGGLIFAICPWGWLQLNKNYAEEDMPMYSILERAGIHFTGHYINGNADGFTVPSIPSTARVPTLIQKCLSSSENLGLYAYDLASLLEDLPLRIVRSTFQDLLDEVEETDFYNLVIPEEKYPLKDNRSKGLLLLSCLSARVRGDKAPGVHAFPGDFEGDVQHKCVRINLDSARRDIFPAAVYLPAGETLEIEIHEGSTDPQKWKVWIGAHSDDLVRSSQWKRLPKVHIKQRLSEDTNVIFSPYGGNVYFESPDEESQLDVTVSNVVESPCYTDHWIGQRDAPGLWADLAGRHIMITLPSSSIKDLVDPSEVLAFWDSVVAAHHVVRTTDVSSHRKQWIVCDVQPVVGYMHSGYPIVTHMDVADPTSDQFLLNHDKLKAEGNWGLYHELGHNMQRLEWTFQGTSEVTVNVFTLHAMDVVNGVKPWIHPWLNNQMNAIKRYLMAGADFTTWKKEPGIALGIYAQLAHHLGWGTYKAVFRKYEVMSNEQKPKTDDEKIRLWITTFAECCGQNLCALFRFWGFTIPNDLQRNLAELPLFLPMDEMTLFVPERIAKVVAEFDGEGGCMDTLPLPAVLATCCAS